MIPRSDRITKRDVSKKADEVFIVFLSVALVNKKCMDLDGYTTS